MTEDLMSDATAVSMAAPSSHQSVTTRDELVEQHLSLVRSVARRYRNRGCELEDIIQVGTIGLIKAIDRFNPDKGVPLAAFIIPYVTGEIRRYFRDYAWSMQVPRRLKELNASIAKAREEISCSDVGEATAQLIADRLNIGVAEVREGLAAANAYSTKSLEEVSGPTRRPLSETLGSADPALEMIDDVHALLTSIRKLSPFQRELLRLRFGGEMTQSQVAASLGLSQTRVSRILARTLAELRVYMSSDHRRWLPNGSGFSAGDEGGAPPSTPIR
ncbi:sigma-70 family RNA polymerase sigma factor [Streptomyces sp. NPDC091376]|uniref:sigma-70 family RNA polymerase sigma factor n=1 Tax=Streptomyces sp. NPDC091376 TaxID=3365994 RepID=UPI00381ACCB6